MVLLTTLTQQITVAVLVALMVGLTAALLLLAIRRSTRQLTQALGAQQSDLADILAELIRNQQLIQDRLDGLQATMEAQAPTAQTEHTRAQLEEQLGQIGEELGQQLRSTAGELQAATATPVQQIARSLETLQEEVRELAPRQQQTMAELAGLLQELAGQVQELANQPRQAIPEAPPGQGTLTTHLERHQVDAMVKLAEFLSEITVGLSGGRIGPPDLPDLQERAIARFHRHGIFLPEPLHQQLQAVLATVLDGGERFYRPTDGEPAPADDAEYLQNGTSLPEGMLQAAASEDGRRCLRILDASLGLLRRIQDELLAGSAPGRRPLPLAPTGDLSQDLP